MTIHNKPEFDNVPTPRWFLQLFDGWHDPFPLGGEMVEPEPGSRVFVNPGYSRKEDAAEACIRWHKAGCCVVMLAPGRKQHEICKAAAPVRSRTVVL